MGHRRPRRQKHRRPRFPADMDKVGRAALEKRDRGRKPDGSDWLAQRGWRIIAEGDEFGLNGRSRKFYLHATKGYRSERA